MSDLRSMRSNVLGAFVAGSIVTAFCLLLFWHDPLLFWNDDYELSILPVFADVARSWDEGHWPLLSPYSWVCSNLAGEFQYGTFSIFVNGVVILIWKLPLAFAQQAAALSITHLFVLGAGAFLLAKKRLSDNTWANGAIVQLLTSADRVRLFPGSATALSIFVALVAALNGWIVCWGATDWFGALGAFAWLPWAWWSLEKSFNLAHPTAVAAAAVLSGRPNEMPPKKPSAGVVDRKRLVMAVLWPAPFVYLVITGGFPYVVVMLALLVAWLSVKSLVENKNIRSIVPTLVGVALGVALAAPAWLALFAYVHGSAREAQPAVAHWQWIVPWRALPGFILPSWTVNWADFSSRMRPHTGTELACGLVAPVALLTAVISGGRAFVRQLCWDLLLLCAILVLAMIPTAGVFRWSFRWLPFFHLTLALCAAEALRRHELRVARPGLLALLLTGSVAVLTGVLHTSGPFSFPLACILLLLSALWLLCEQWRATTSVRHWLPAAITFAALLATYLCIPPNCGVPKYNLAPALNDPAPLDRSHLYLSVYPWAELNYGTQKRSGSVGQVVRLGSTSMFAGLKFINGYSPIRPAGIAREFKFTIHGEIDPDVAEAVLRDQSGALAELGIDGLSIAKEINLNPLASEWQLVFSNEEGRVYHRSGATFAPVRSVEWIDSIPDRTFAVATVSRIDDSRNRVEADVDVPEGEKSALLKFTRPYFPGYVGRLGHTALLVSSYRGLLPMVEVPGGSHGRVVLAYRPRWLVYGGGLAVAGAAMWILGVVAVAVSGRR